MKPIAEISDLRKENKPIDDLKKTHGLNEGDLRLVCGEKHGSAKLTNLKAREIKDKYAKGGYSHRSLGDEYGISKGAVGRLLNGLTYKDS